MFCSKCGQTIQDGDIACRNCGEKISSLQEKPSEPLRPVVLASVDTSLRSSELCPKCGTVSPAGTRFCGMCAQPLVPMVQSTVYSTPEKNVSGMALAKLCLGIISIILSLFVSLHACGASASYIAENGRTNEGAGGAGLVLAFFLLVAGIVGIVARNSRGGALAVTLLYGMCVVLGSIVSQDDGYEDFMIWVGICFCFGIVFFVSVFKQNYKRQ